MKWIIVPLGIVGLVSIVVTVQRRFIYFPRRYEPVESEHARAAGVQEIRFQTSQGHQVAFYWRNSDFEAAPESIWLLFAGNGSVALDWMRLIPQVADPRTGFLLVEYPGYGVCEGSPSPQAILENSENAFRALLEQKHWEPDFEAISVLGHSLGGAAALQFAARHQVRKIVLISTFTTMADMVRARILISLGPLLRHQFDNIASLRAILSQQQVPEITIFHGKSDLSIPVRMGRALYQLDPSRIRFVAIPRAGHNNLLEQAVAQGLGGVSQWPPIER